jgi:hypothetical protein
MRVRPCLQPLEVWDLELELHHCLHQVQEAKVRPQHPGEHQQRVAALPQQEVGEARLAAGAHQQVHGRAARSVKRRIQG